MLSHCSHRPLGVQVSLTNPVQCLCPPYQGLHTWVRLLCSLSWEGGSHLPKIWISCGSVLHLKILLSDNEKVYSTDMACLFHEYLYLATARPNTSNILCLPPNDSVLRNSYGSGKRSKAWYLDQSKGKNRWSGTSCSRTLCRTS